MEETSTTIKAFPNVVVLIEIYYEAILQGHKFAFIRGKTDAELAKTDSNAVHEDFFEMETTHVNQSLLLWLALGRIAIDAFIQGRNNILFSFFHKLKAFIRYQTGPLSDEDKQTLDTIQLIFSVAGGFLASTNFRAGDISYQDLHELLCSTLQSNWFGAQSKLTGDITVALFVLAGATCKVAKDFFNS